VPLFVVELRNNRNYVLYQAMRRIWRPFAPLPVEVYFAVYRGTAEEMILDLMGEKILSNQLLTGQEVGGALVPEDAGNVLQVAVNRLLKGDKTKQATSILAGQNTMTASPLGSPTASSPEVKPMMTWEKWRTLYIFRQTCNVRGVRKKPCRRHRCYFRCKQGHDCLSGPLPSQS